MALSAQQLAEITVLVEQYAEASQQLKDTTAAAATAGWRTFTAWYDAAAVAAVAYQALNASQAAQDVAIGMSEHFIAAAVESLQGGTRTIPGITLPPLRRGADLGLVYMRTASAYRRAIATGSDQQQALAIAIQRSEGLVTSDLALRDRDAQNATMRALGVTTFRRVVHPELSKSGSCGLCIVASDRVYRTGNLMPMHFPSCKCTVMPIIDGKDPGDDMNKVDLKRLYEEAGSTKAEDLRKTRYKVHQHGELGPNLADAGDSFRSAAHVPLEKDPARAARMLDKTLPVLARLEAAGGPPGPLAYQRDLVARLRAITGAH